MRQTSRRSARTVIRTAVARLLGRSVDSTPEWSRTWLATDRVRWRRGDETVECFRCADGVVATVSYADRGVTWQLTAGPAPLASALFTAGLYMQYGITPQIDADGRTFVAVDQNGPTQVFDEEPARPVEFVYTDAFRTVEELPEYVDIEPLESAHHRFATDERHRLASE
ncbi:hypothetical protein ACFQE1_05220 [Halobium palmae]|uniref:Uncharacterized protein n=1 Tax=Halobium palmae TaxID=1776492 RepID=A0ABD5RWL4_9EURY